MLPSRNPIWGTWGIPGRSDTSMTGRSGIESPCFPWLIGGNALWERMARSGGTSHTIPRRGWLNSIGGNEETGIGIDFAQDAWEMLARKTEGSCDLISALSAIWLGAFPIQLGMVTVHRCPGILIVGWTLFPNALSKRGLPCPI